MYDCYVFEYIRDGFFYNESPGSYHFTNDLFEASLYFYGPTISGRTSEQALEYKKKCIASRYRAFELMGWTNLKFDTQDEYKNKYHYLKDVLQYEL